MKMIKEIEEILKKQIDELFFSINLIVPNKGLCIEIFVDDVKWLKYTFKDFEDKKNAIQIETTKEQGCKCVLWIEGLEKDDLLNLHLHYLRNLLEVFQKFLITHLKLFFRKKWQELGFFKKILELGEKNKEDILKNACEFLYLFLGIKPIGIVYYNGEKTISYLEKDQELNIFYFLNISKDIVKNKRTYTYFGFIEKFFVYFKYFSPYIIILIFKKPVWDVYRIVFSFLTNELFWILMYLKAKKIEDQSYQEMINLLINTLDARDIYTRGHSEGVMFYTSKVGEEIRLGSEEMDILKQSALLHDIGKIAIPDHILLKPSKLTKSEFEIIKLHPVIGAKLVEPIEMLSHLAPIIKAHHERYDGKGYPEGLKGEDIPFLARIITICDVYDALTHERVYRKAFTKEEALKILQDNIGKMFDPKISEKALLVFKKLPVYSPYKEDLIFSQLASIKFDFLYKDLLTGVYNLNALYLHAKDINTKVTLVYIMLRDFYYLNLIKGPFETDKIMSKLCNELIKYFGEENIYKIGPGEFIVLIYDPKIEQKIEKVLKTIGKELKISIVFKVLKTLVSLKTLDKILKDLRIIKEFNMFLYNTYFVLKYTCKKVAVFDKNFTLFYKKGIREKELSQIPKSSLVPIRYFRKIIGYFYCSFD